MAKAGATKVAQDERDRCAADAEEQRQQQQVVVQATRAADMAERQAEIAYGQAKSAFVQTIATILAFGAAVMAALYARQAVTEGKRSADAAVAMQRPWVDIEVVVKDPMQLIGKDMIYVPLQVILTNRGTTPAQSICQGYDYASHTVDDYEIELHWPRAAERAAAEAAANIGITLFPGIENAHKHSVSLFFRPDSIEAEDGMFLISHGMVVTYKWGDDGVGITKITGVITSDGDHPDWFDGWRFNLAALVKGENLAFKYERHLFRDRYE